MVNYSLNKIPVNSCYKIEKINCTGNDRRRFLDLGMVKGTKIKPILISPSGDPVAYEVRGTIIALRKEDSSKIEVIG